MRRRLIPSLLAALGLIATGEMQAAEALSPKVDQLVISIAPTWNSSKGRLQLFERDGSSWKAVGTPVRVLYGTNGLAWGRGELGQAQTGLQKIERDKRAPAGLFALGKIFTYDSILPAGSNYPFRTLTQNDAWVDDPANPYYNQHVVIDPANPPPWFEKQKMRHDDPPHRWMVEIRHNADPPVPGAGSAIFFHIQRGVDRTSAGCTVMPKDDLLSMITWLRADKDPHYLLLPREEYLRLWKSWKLPDPKVLGPLLGSVAGN
jgi:L,D-peptidoglycan transpeptidase YkuD (ErfK/YbiS/YcfS/YnhG family)